MEATEIQDGPGFRRLESLELQDATAVVRADKVERAAQDLSADFHRQQSSLRQAQFDRLVLRRNLTPAENVAVLVRLRELGVALETASSTPTKPQTSDPVGNHSMASGSEHPLPARRTPYALLTSQEEIELGRRLQLALRMQGELDPSKVFASDAKEIVRRGRAARERMIVANLRLVRFVIANMKRSAQSLDHWDLYQEGVIGLMRAVEKFDPELGLRFSTYAMWWVRQAIFRGLDDTDRTIRLPVHRLDGIRRMRLVTRRLTSELGRDPSMRELAEGLNWSLEKTLFVRRLTELDCISLDAPVGQEDGRTVADTIPSREPDSFEIARVGERARLIQQIIGRLTPRQQLVIERRFGLTGSSETLQQVGDDLGVTRERIRQIEAKALQRLQRWVTRRVYDSFL